MVEVYLVVFENFLTKVDLILGHEFQPKTILCEGGDCRGAVEGGEVNREEVVCR